MRKLTVIPRTAVAALTVLSLGSGCSSDADSTREGIAATPTSTPSSPEIEHNEADITVTQEMIVHYRQAAKMIALTETRASAPEVKDVAANIKQAQEPQIQQMTDWLTRWGARNPSPGNDDRDGNITGVLGMTKEQEMRTLHAATGATFDRMFLQLMIGHHEEAVQLAILEQRKGRNEAATTLAAQIEKSQKREIEMMQGLLARR